MLRRITDLEPEMPREILLLPRLQAAPRTGLGLPTLRVGRGPNNDVVLSSAGIPLLLSRQHAVFTYDGEQFVVKDLEATNGTYVRGPLNGPRSDPAPCGSPSPPGFAQAWVVCRPASRGWDARSAVLGARAALLRAPHERPHKGF